MEACKTEEHEGILVTLVTFAGQPALLACDGRCEAAWGRNGGRHQRLPDGRLPADDDTPWDDTTMHGQYGSPHPDSTEGGQGKPTDRRHNKWCARECERNVGPCRPAERESLLRQVTARAAELAGEARR